MMQQINAAWADFFRMENVTAAVVTFVLNYAAYFA